MAQHNELGKRGEKIATDHLEDKGYRIIEKNYRAGRGEVDIIARDSKGALVFFEVKSRMNFERPEEAVNKKKIQILMDTMESFKHKNNIVEEIFLDIIAINFLNKKDFELSHFKDVWI